MDGTAMNNMLSVKCVGFSFSCYGLTCLKDSLADFSVHRPKNFNHVGFPVLILS